MYWKARLIDWRVVRWSLAFGIPATIIGAVATRWIGGSILVTITDGILVVVVGLISGLLANSGGFLLAPLYVAVLRLPIKAAFASSLAVAAVLAVPGTIVHSALSHIDWALVAVFAATSVPLSFLGARVALRTDPARLERLYGAAISLLGIVFLIAR